MRQFLNEPGHFFISDHLVALLYIVLLTIWAKWYDTRKHASNPFPGSAYFFKGFLVKILGSYLFALVYFFLYNGGDTAAYFQNALIMNRLFVDNISGYFYLMWMPEIKWEDYFLYFNHNTGYPQMSISYKDANHIVVKFATLLAPLGMFNFFSTSILFGAITYFFVFKAYKTFCLIVPDAQKFLAFAFLFFPSFVFWGGGIMKDTICVAAISQIVYSFYQIFILKKRNLLLIAAILISVYILFITKPYLLFALIPGLVFWGAFGFIGNIKSSFIKFGLVPLMGVLALFATFYLLNNAIISVFGSTEMALERAAITQQDLIRSEQYGSNFYDIGRYDPSISGMIQKAPEAITVGLFMPFLWQAGSAITYFSALENFVLLLLTLYFIFKTRIYGIFTYTFRNPILFFCISFALITAFIVGITTANFGALVRYKIPLLPYFLCFFILLDREVNKKVGTDFTP